MEGTEFFVLIVDDSDAVVNSVSRTVTEMGCKIATAVNGQEALIKVQERHPDLILMDLYMPVMDGLAASTSIRELESSENRKRATIIAMSAAPDARACEEAGMDAFLTKPVNSDSLRKAINKFWQKPDGGSETNGCGPRPSHSNKHN